MLGERSWRHAAQTIWERLSLRQTLLVLGAVILLVSGLFGGLSEASPDAVAKAHAGKPVEVAPLTITVERVRWTTELTSSLKSERGRYLIVVAKVRTVEDRAVGSATVTDAVRLRAVDGIFADLNEGKQVDAAEARASVFVNNDGTRLGRLAPGMTFEVAYVWEQDGEQPPPTSVEVELFHHTWRKSSIDTQMDWRDPALGASGTFPVTKTSDS